MDVGRQTLFLLDLNTYTERLKLVGIIAIVISVVAWASDLTGHVYECPYCRTQRTVIGLLGLILLLPNPGHWVARYVATVIGFLGLHVGSAQHFAGWRRISAGEFSFHERIYIDPFLLSGCALFIITGLVWLILMANKAEDEAATA